MSLAPTSVTAFSIGSNLDQFPLLDEQIDHAQDRRWLRFHLAADLRKAETIFLVLEQVDQSSQHDYPNPSNFPPWYTRKAASQATTV